MKALVMVLLLTLVGANVVVPYNNFDTVGYYDYEGVIGPELRIQMSIYVNGEEVKGYYIYEKYRKEIELKGRVEGNAIRLNEYSDGVPCGVFDGTVETVEAWSGTWRSLKTGKQYPLSLSLNSIIETEYGHRFRTPGWERDDDLVQFVGTIQQYLKTDQKAKLADLVSYPIYVKIDGARVNVADKKQFVRFYDKVFTPGYKRIICDAFPRTLFSNWQGVRIGEGLQNMWVSHVSKDLNIEPFRPRIIAVNN